jgi:DNA-binding NarL/FixJ family response regulator
MTDASPIRVVLVDDHEMVLESLTSCFEQHPSIRVVGTARTSDELQRMVRETKPQVVVLDLHLPGRGAFDAVADLREENPDVKVLFLSGFLADVFVTQALRLRVNGYLMKGASITSLVDAIQRVAAGETVYAREVENRITFDPVSRRDVAKNESDLSALTGRQLEVLRHLARGESVKDIASQMHLSQKSVDSHKYRIMNKLGIHDRVELARFAIREGLMIP